MSGSTINAVRINESLEMGLGVGFDNAMGMSLVPVFLDIRIYAPGGSLTPMISAQAGYSLGFIEGREGSDYGGVMLGTGVGIRFPRSRGRGATLERHDRWQASREVVYRSFYLGYGPDRRQATIDMIGASLGVAF